MNSKLKHNSDATRWEQRYAEGGPLPWDTGTPDPELKQVIQAHNIQPAKALEIGCGTGTNALWLAAQGFTVTAVDISTTAIELARKKADDARMSCTLMTGDFLADDIPGVPFQFVYDRGVFHTFDTAELQAQFAARIAAMLGPDGMWHSLIGSTDGPPRDTGPPRRTAAEVVTAVEPFFEVLELHTTLFDTTHHTRARAWVLVARRRARSL